jgi:4-hydroxybenzoyl-CoA reductase subunit beta
MEFLPPFTLHRPGTIEDAVALRSGDRRARYLAGGTDMVVNVRRGIEQPTALIDLSQVEGMHGIEEHAGGWRVGASTTLDTLGKHAEIARSYPAVAQAARAVAGPTHRGYGTVGGNLCLDTRCLYYNQSEWWRRSNNYCLKRNGMVCHVAPGGKQCFAAFSGDVAPAMLVHDAEVELAGPEGVRRVPLAQIYNDDGMNHLALRPAELVVAAHLPRIRGAAKSGYLKSRVRGSIDFPLAGCAVRLTMHGDTLSGLRIALTGVSPRPHLVEGTAPLVGKPLDADALDRIRETVRKEAKPMHTTTVKPWYRRRVVGALARRLVETLAHS